MYSDTLPVSRPDVPGTSPCSPQYSEMVFCPPGLELILPQEVRFEVAHLSRIGGCNWGPSIGSGYFLAE